MTEVLQSSPQTAETTTVFPPEGREGGDGVVVGGGEIYNPTHPPRSQMLAILNADTIYSHAFNRSKLALNTLPLAVVEEESESEASQINYPSANRGGGLTRRKFLIALGFFGAAAVIAACSPGELFDDPYTKKKKMVASGEFPDDLSDDEVINIIGDVTWNEYTNRFFPQEKDKLAAPEIKWLDSRDISNVAADALGSVGYPDITQDSFLDLYEFYDFNNHAILFNKDASIWQAVGPNQAFKSHADKFKEIAYLVLNEYSVSLADMMNITTPYKLYENDQAPFVQQKLGLAAYVQPDGGRKISFDLFQYSVADDAAQTVAQSLGLTVPYESEVTLTDRELIQMVKQRLGITTEELLSQIRNDTVDIGDFFLFLGNKNKQLDHATVDEKKFFGLKLWILISLYSLTPDLSAADAFDRMDQLLAPYNLTPVPEPSPSTPHPPKFRGRRTADLLPLNYVSDETYIGMRDHFHLPASHFADTTVRKVELHPVVKTIFRRFLRPQN